MLITPELVQEYRAKYPGEKLVVDRTFEEAKGDPFEVIFSSVRPWQADLKPQTICVIDNHKSCVTQAIQFIEEQLPEYIPMGIVQNIDIPTQQVVDTASTFATMAVIHKPEYVHGDCPECNKAREKQISLLAAGVDARLTRLDLRVSSCQQDLRNSILTFTLKVGSKVRPPAAFEAKRFMTICTIAAFPDGRPSYKLLHEERHQEIGFYLLEEAIAYIQN